MNQPNCGFAILFALACLLFSTAGYAAELATLNSENYESLAPAGKEVDAIHGDHVLQNERLIAVIAAVGEERDANLTVRNVGGSVIDLTVQQDQRDQLSCFYPGGGLFRLESQIDWRDDLWGKPVGATIAFTGVSLSPAGSPLRIAVGYELRTDEPFVRIVSTVTNAETNTGESPIKYTPVDSVRADGDTFKTGVDHEANLWWTYDSYWRQAYGVQPEAGSAEVDRGSRRNGRRSNEIVYPADRNQDLALTLEPGESYTWQRRLFPAASNVDLQTHAYDFLQTPTHESLIRVTAAAEPVASARVRVIRTPDDGGAGERVSLGVGLTDENGKFTFRLPTGRYQLRVSSYGHESATTTVRLPGNEATVELSEPAYAEATITDASGQPIPAKVAFAGVGDTPSPKFGPAAAVRGVQNLQYTPDGRFRCKLAPGTYRWIASYGPEYDAANGEFTVGPGDTAMVEASLEHSVATPGYLSSELHSHSTPSGDNTASQAGRVLNLLAEHLEFCPCTEHQRIDVYDEHLAAMNAAQRMLTCPGMELTGSPLPLNHQNAFPLKHSPHEQDGGGPQTDPNPVEQIKRIAEWDDNSEKVVQTNHPDIAQMIGDRDQNGVADEGFEAMFGYMDVMEVHPPELIFTPLNPGEPTDSGVGTGGWDGRGNAMINWLQMLNLGYRVTGVVNTDAHYNWHGSGWMRNWVRSSTDDPAEASVAELVHAFEHGHVVISNGPYLMVEATADGATAIPGDDLAAPSGKATIRVVVRTPNWIEVNRVQLFVNGRPLPEHNYTVRTHADWFRPGPEIFDRQIEIKLAEDAHVVVACCGEGTSLASMYGEGWGRGMPTAVANPVFIDTDGDADADGIRFEPNGDNLGLPLPTVKDLKPSHGHDHPNHRH